MTGMVMVDHVAGTAEQDGVLLDTRLCHVALTFFDSFCIGKVVRMMHIEGYTACSAVLALAVGFGLGFQFLLLAATFRPALIGIGLGVLNFIHPGTTQRAPGKGFMPDEVTIFRKRSFAGHVDIQALLMAFFSFSDS